MFGIINCDKPVGMTSRDVVNVVQRRVRPVKVGHAGTLDPLASGVLLLAVGPAVRLVPYLQRPLKEYEATFRLGAWSDSGDLEGTVHQLPPAPLPTRQVLQAAAATLTGWITQRPPALSAVKIGGRRSYALARQGRAVEVPERRVFIDQLEITGYEPPSVWLRIACGSGTYIRTLGIDLARAAGTAAVMTALRRTAIGRYRVDAAVPLDSLRDADLSTVLLPPVEAVASVPRAVLSPPQLFEVEHGRGIAIDAAMIQAAELEPTPHEPDREKEEERTTEGGSEARVQEIAAVDCQGRLRAILIPRGDAWGPRRVFPASPSFT